MIDWAGVGTYSYNLLKSLQQIDKDNEYILFCEQQSAAQVPQTRNFRRRVVTERVFSAFHQLLFSLSLKRHSLDIFHSPHFVYPLFVSSPSVVTIHDLIPLVFPASMRSSVARTYYRRANKKAIGKAERIIAVSESTKRDIQKVFGVAGEKIALIPNGVADSFKVISNEASLDGIKKRCRIRSKYILNVGNPKPHKNWTGLVEAFAALDEGFSDYQLVLVGSSDPRFPQVVRLIKRLGLEDRVMITGFVSEKDMVLLYNAAEMFVFPSLYEGFGLPVLEAMACGTPVVSSNTSSLPEVVGDAGILFDPNDKTDLVKGIEMVLSNEELRQDLLRRGLERIRHFSWTGTAQQTLEVYQQMLHGR